jgi:cardiolipin synthase
MSLHGPAAADLAMSFIAFWNRFCKADERITQWYHRSVDSRITVSRNEAMRLSFPIRDLYIAAIDKAEQFIFLTTAYFVPDQMLLDALKMEQWKSRPWYNKVSERILAPLRFTM